MVMKAGDIVFVRGNTPLSNIIRLFDKGEFSHVAMAVSSTHVIEAEYNSKVQITPMDYTDYKVIDLGLTDEERDKIVHHAIDLTGKRYDYMQILGYIFSTKTPLGSPNALICSEVIYLLLKDVGIDIGNRFIKPNELYKMMAS